MRFNVDFSDLGLTNHIFRDPLGVSIVCKGIVSSRLQCRNCCCLGYGIREDMRMLVKAIPVLNGYLTDLSIIDIHILHQQVPV